MRRTGLGCASNAIRRSDRLSGFCSYTEGVSQQSPGSRRSRAPWVTRPTADTPTGFHKDADCIGSLRPIQRQAATKHARHPIVKPRWGMVVCGVIPRVRFATLGSVVKRRCRRAATCGRIANDSRPRDRNWPNQKRQHSRTSLRKRRWRKTAGWRNKRSSNEKRTFVRFCAA